MDLSSSTSVDVAIIQILQAEGLAFLSAYPTTPLIDAAASQGLRPVLCRQERVGVGIAEGYSWANGGRPAGAFAMQFGPGVENAYSGIASAYADGTPTLCLPTGYPEERIDTPRVFSADKLAGVTKAIERLRRAEDVIPVMRRAFSRLKMGRGGPVVVELPRLLAGQPLGTGAGTYAPVAAVLPAPAPAAIEAAIEILAKAKRPLILAGQGALYSSATEELVRFAELIDAPVGTTLEGKSAFPEDHALAVGAGGFAMPQPLWQAFEEADVVVGVGASFSVHDMVIDPPVGKVVIQITIDENDFNKGCETHCPIHADARLALRALNEGLQERRLGATSWERGSRTRIQERRDPWLAAWHSHLTSDERPINPYRVVGELAKLDASEIILTHDSGSPRDQIMPFYAATAPRGYIGWGKSHALGSGLGLCMGAKLARPEKVCINVMGDAAFGMVGLDFETAVRNQIPIITIVHNNQTMAVEKDYMPIAHERYRTRDIFGRYADIGRALGGWARTVEEPHEIKSVLEAAIEQTKEGQAALIEVITSPYLTPFSCRRHAREVGLPTTPHLSPDTSVPISS